MRITKEQIESILSSIDMPLFYMIADDDTPLPYAAYEFTETDVDTDDMGNVFIYSDEIAISIYTHDYDAFAEESIIKAIAPHAQNISISHKYNADEELYIATIYATFIG